MVARSISVEVIEWYSGTPGAVRGSERSPLALRLSRLVDARPGEGTTAAWAFASFFALLAGYYVLRSLREEMGIRGGVENLPWNFTATFGLMLVAVPLYSALVARVPRARAIPLVYRFFLVTLLYELQRRNLKRGIATLCLGGGNGGDGNRRADAPRTHDPIVRPDMAGTPCNLSVLLVGSRDRSAESR